MMILLTGGSGCGKSSYAERLCMQMPLPRYYLATMKPFGPESERKIARHREMRATKGFETIERHTDLSGLFLPERGTVLLECLCNLSANEMYDENWNELDPFDTIVEGVSHISEQADNFILVTNDVGADGETYDESTMRYIRLLGRLNAVFAAKADCVYELVCGIPLVRKGELLL